MYSLTYHHRRRRGSLASADDLPVALALSSAASGPLGLEAGDRIPLGSEYSDRKLSRLGLERYIHSCMNQVHHLCRHLQVFHDHDSVTRLKRIPRQLNWIRFGTMLFACVNLL